eukprot:COSAG02_NODE_41989_length_389_cov_0.524138_1_plen_28_part_10
MADTQSVSAALGIIEKGAASVAIQRVSY